MSKTAVMVLLVILLAVIVQAGKDQVPEVCIQPLGYRLPAADLAMVSRGIDALYGFRVRVLPRRALPRSAWYPRRRRYRAEKLLAYLRNIRPPGTKFILGLTAVDISTTKDPYPDWGIMGLATLDGAVCVISSFRCRMGSRNILHARERLAKTAVHELGHNLALDHCPNRGCLMEDAKGTNRTTDREYDLCHSCRRLLKGWGYLIPKQPKLPWRRP